MNKQIEEMAKVIGDADQKCYEIEDCNDCSFHCIELGLCKERFIADALYTAGYRKQSEVARERGRAECPTCHGTGRIGTTDWLTKNISKEQLAKEKAEAIAEHELHIKQDYAREIFEEIEKSVTSKIPPYIRPIFKDDLDFEDGFRNGKIDALYDVLVIIAELKKKYTKEEGEKKMDKQIEEMAKICCELCEFEHCGECTNDDVDCGIGECYVAEYTAKKLYEAGYRKQSEGGAECPICHGTGQIGTTDWLTRHLSKKQLAEEKAKATADVVEVVRCKDCTEWDEKAQECSHWYGFRDNDFCSYGKRRTDNELH